MAITRQEIRELLASPELAAVEEAIARDTGRAVYRENLDITCGSGSRSLGDPEATADDEEYPPWEEPDPDDLTGEREVLALGSGFGLTYLVYLYYLRERPPQEFVAYLKKRQIPHAAKFAADLRRVFSSMGSA